MANRLSYPSCALRRVSGFSANLNLRVQSSRVSCRHLPGSVKTYQGEDIRRFECNIVEGFAILLSFGISRDNILGNALEFLEGKAHTALVGVHPSVSSKSQRFKDANILFVKVFLLVQILSNGKTGPEQNSR